MEGDDGRGNTLLDHEGAELVLHLLAVNGENEPAGETWVPLPDDVDPSNVESAVRAVFGEPLAPALDRHDTLGVIRIGWYFDNARLEAFGLPAEGNEALVIPCLVGEDGSATRLYVANELERQAFSDALGADNVTEVDGRTG
ncbi:MAG: hypothetical protein ACOYOP_16360, partial [Microthrixaceae bacterium]